MPIRGTMRARTVLFSATRATKSSSPEPVANRTLARLSVEGHRSFPLAEPRLLLLKVVGSSPASLASPEGDMPCRAASSSMARQIWEWVNILGNNPQVAVIFLNQSQRKQVRVDFRSGGRVAPAIARRKRPSRDAEAGAAGRSLSASGGARRPSPDGPR